MQERLMIEKKDMVCTIAINRPDKKNALSPMLLLQLTDILNRLKEENEIRCVVIRGSGENVFSSGYDISDLPINVSPEVAEAAKGDTPLDNCMKAVTDFPYPVIAMINGLAYGAGCELGITCDIRISADHARFCMPPAKLGIVYRWRGVLRFIDIIGPGNAKEMFFSGRSYEAHRAKEMGLVNYVLPHDQLSTFVYEMAQDISENAPLSLKALKVIFNRFHHEQRFPFQDVHEVESLRYEAFRSDDIKEGEHAFREKRKPIFKGR
jgi:enoyl-CoA hydratase